ncbi:MAG TPA: hypothetical protein VKS60_18565 [Stellaceae bacterium]|nr:hypothetical protein [Stellaceae bacterium]
MSRTRNPVARAVRSPKFRPRIVRSKKSDIRRPKHPARAADVFGVTSLDRELPVRMKQ